MKRILLVATIALSIWLLLAIAAYACNCCPDPSVKVEWHHHWQYDEDINDGTVVISGTQRLLCWQTITGTAVIAIRTKSGQDIGCYKPEGSEQFNGCIEAGRHDFSSAWFCTEQVPTAVTLVDFSAQETMDNKCIDIIILILVIGAVVLYLLNPRR
jgi:hypothetical protein